MILYHGSNIPIDIIDLAKSKPNKDFGRGFYLSESEEQAMEMALFKSMQLGGEAIISKFEFDKEIMNDESLKIKTFDSYTEQHPRCIHSEGAYECILHRSRGCSRHYSSSRPGCQA